MQRNLPGLVGSLVLLMAGCTTVPAPKLTPMQIASADYGANPKDHEKLVKDWAFHTVVDPFRMEMDDIGQPFRAYDTTTNRFGYGVYFWLAAAIQENGPVTGWKREVAFIRDNRVLDVREGSMHTDGHLSGRITTFEDVE